MRNADPKRASALAASVTGEVIPRLRQRHGVEAQDAPPRPKRPPFDTKRDGPNAGQKSPFTDPEIAAFARALMARGDDEWRKAFAGHVKRLPRRLILRDGLLAPTAELLGEWWSSDEASMVDVTVATSRLQAALDELPERPVDGDGPRMLLTTAPGDTHVFGLFMLADALREADWFVHVELRPNPARLDRIAARDTFDLVGIGIAATRYVPGAVTLAQTLDRGSCGRLGVPIIAGGAGAPGSEEALLASGFALVVPPGPNVAERVHRGLSTLRCTSKSISQPIDA